MNDKKRFGNWTPREIWICPQRVTSSGRQLHGNAQIASSIQRANEWGKHSRRRTRYAITVSHTYPVTKLRCLELSIWTNTRRWIPQQSFLLSKTEEAGVQAAFLSSKLNFASIRESLNWLDRVIESNLLYATVFRSQLWTVVQCGLMLCQSVEDEGSKATAVQSLHLGDEKTGSIMHVSHILLFTIILKQRIYVAIYASFSRRYLV